jgi:hypothetical protein
MNRPTFRLCLGLTLVGALSPSLLSQEPAKKDTAHPIGWRAFGRVTDQDGKPLPGAEVWAHCGSGTLFRTGTATSGDDGRYELRFGPGITTLGGKATFQAATISAHKRGYFEENLSRQGNCSAADGPPTEADIKRWHGHKDRLFLPDRPVELNFSMRPAARVAGRLVDEQARPLAKYSVALTGAELPPSSSVLCSARADEQGKFAFENIPTTFLFQFEVRKSDPKPPWDDTWASAALRFERPDDGDLRAWFGKREIRLQEFVLRVAGPGFHGRDAVPIAGNAGTLDLTRPLDVQEKSDTLLAAKSAVLTLRNATNHDLSQSLVTESVPAPPERTSARLARTRPDDTGECAISFENPRGWDLEPGKHQVIFQLFVGVSQKPIREKILRQLDVLKEGRYRVPVRIPPDLIDDSRVSITFVTIQPEHDTWVKTFFVDGKGTNYRGLWTSDGGPLPAIPLETASGQ